MHHVNQVKELTQIDYPRPGLRLGETGIRAAQDDGASIDSETGVEHRRHLMHVAHEQLEYSGKDTQQRSPLPRRKAERMSMTWLAPRLMHPRGHRQHGVLERAVSLAIDRETYREGRATPRPHTQDGMRAR